MNPISILFVLSLAGPLDSPRFSVRESAQLALERQPFADCWPAVYWLAASSRLEVSERANRWLGKQEMLAASEWLAAAIEVDVERKPWRVVHAVECSQRDPIAWGKKWGPVVAELLRAKYGDFLDPWNYSMCQDGGPFMAGQVAGMVFQVRRYGVNGYYCNSGDW